MNLGRQLLGRNQVMSGVPEMIYDASGRNFPDGSKLVTVHHPIASENGNLSLALHGSFLPVPDVSVFKPVADEPIPGSTEIKTARSNSMSVAPMAEIPVTNLGDRPIQVGSHYHFIETNAALPGLIAGQREANASTFQQAQRFVLNPGETKR